MGVRTGSDVCGGAIGHEQPVIDIYGDAGLVRQPFFQVSNSRPSSDGYVTDRRSITAVPRLSPLP